MLKVERPPLVGANIYTDGRGSGTSIPWTEESSLKRKTASSSEESSARQTTTDLIPTDSQAFFVFLT